MLKHQYELYISTTNLHKRLLTDFINNRTQMTYLRDEQYLKQNDL